MRVGLTGGLACGKSFVGKILQECGAHVIQADELGHQTLAPDGEAYAAAVAEFGPSILNPDRTIDRHKLATKVFDNPGALARLNAIVHPAVYRLCDALETAIRAAEPDAIIVNEAAILIETGTYRNYDRIILVTCDEHQQLERALSRGAATPEDVQARIARQLPLETKRKFADFVIDTSGAKEDTARQTREVYQKLKLLPVPTFEPPAA